VIEIIDMHIDASTEIQCLLVLFSSLPDYEVASSNSLVVMCSELICCTIK